MKNLNMLKWIVLVVTLILVTAIFFLVTENHLRDGRFYVALASLLISLLVSAFVTDIDLFFEASKMEEFPNRMAFITLTVFYQAFVFISILLFFFIRPLNLRLFSAVMLGWLLIFIVLSYALIVMHRFILSNMSAGKAMGIKRGSLMLLLQNLSQIADNHPIASKHTLFNQKVEDLCETIRYSDPVSREEVRGLDESIIKGLEEVIEEIDRIKSEEEIESAIRHMHETKQLAERRNQQLIGLK